MPSFPAPNGSCTSIDSSTDCASDGNSTTSASTNAPPSSRSVTRTRLKGTTDPDPSTANAVGICGSNANAAVRRPPSGPVTSRPQERRLSPAMRMGARKNARRRDADRTGDDTRMLGWEEGD